MSARVLSLGISPQERARLCLVAAEEVALQAAHYVRRAEQLSADDEAAAPYVRAVYVYQATAAVAERVSLASGEECGSYLRDVLRACAASVARPSVACWLTVMMEDTCVVQHAVFAMTATSTKPQSWTTALVFQPDSGPFQPGAVRWSLTTQPVLGRAAPAGNVCTPPDAALAAAEVAAAPHEAEPRVQPEPAQPQQVQHPAPAASAAVARSMGTTPCAHSTRTLAKVMAAVNPQRDEAVVARQHVAPPQSNAQSSAAAPPTPLSSVYDRMAKYQVDAAADPAPRRQDDQEQAQPHAAAEESATPSAAQSLRSGHAPNGLLVYDSPQADLVAPSDGRQCGDLAYRSRYAPRREELWDIANAVMTHNYAAAAIGAGEQPAYIEDNAA